jgi:hypothetical protein
MRLMFDVMVLARASSARRKRLGRVRRHLSVLNHLANLFPAAVIAHHIGLAGERREIELGLRRSLAVATS